MLILSLSLTLLVLTAALIILAWVIRKQSPPKGERTGNLLLFALVTGAMINTGSYAFELLTPDINVKFVWVFFRYVGSFLLLTAALFFALWYIGRTDFLTRNRVILFCLPSLLLFIAILTNGIHHLYYPDLWLSTTYEVPQLLHSTGPLYYLGQCWAIVLMFSSLGILIGARFIAPRAYGRAGILVFLGLALPVLAYFLYLFGFRPFGFLNITSYFLVVTAFTLTFATLWFRIHSLQPIAHHMLLNKLPAGMVVLDSQFRIIEINPVAAHFLAIDENRVIEKQLTDVISSDDPVLLFCESKIASTRIIERKSWFLELSLTPLENHNRSIIGYLLLLHDISNTVRVTEALRTANHKLHILSDITRHDIRNQLTAIQGYLELDLMNAGDPARVASINKERQIAGTIDTLIQFTKMYEDLGLFEPAWIALKPSITSASAEAIKNNIDLIDMTGPFEIYADPLFGKIFFNLIDNAGRHGEHVTWIRFSTQRDGNDLLMICEDNGIGIAYEHKEKIFNKGFGTNTGFGLFFVREILSITGLAITENGNPGTGARFVIRMPAGKFRETP